MPDKILTSLDCTLETPHYGPCNGWPRWVTPDTRCDGAKRVIESECKVNVVTNPADVLAIHAAAEEALQAAREHRVRGIQQMFGGSAGICATCVAIVADTVAHQEWHWRKLRTSMMTNFGKVAYNGYLKRSGGVSLISGAKLPEFEALPIAIQEDWVAAADAVIHQVSEEGDAG